jgi:hypothetical protein
MGGRPRDTAMFSGRIPRADRRPESGAGCRCRGGHGEASLRGTTGRDAAFFPVTCHPVVSRRQFLAGAGALVASGAATSGVGRAASDEGRAIIQKHATVAEDPWAVAHGIRAMGRDFTIKGGRRAVDYLLESVLVSVPAGGKSVLGFRPEVEVHPNAFLAEALLEPGVPLGHEFTHAGSRRALRDVMAGARALFRPRQVMSDANALPWSLIAFALTTSPSERRWTNAWGEPVDLDVVVESSLRLLEQASLPIAQAMRENRPESAKAPVHGFTCGGTHMLYALLTAVRAGYVGTDRAERVRRQVDLMVWRLGADIALIERFYKDRAGHQGAFWYEIDAKLKLLGHGEECLALGVRRGLVALTSAQQEQRRTAVRRIRHILDELERRRLEEPRALNRELFRQLVGDTCHAWHGLSLV